MILNQKSEIGKPSFKVNDLDSNKTEMNRKRWCLGNQSIIFLKK